MGAKRFQDLVAWQLSAQLAAEVFDMTRRPCFDGDWSFRDQLRESSAAIPANVAEGFGRFRPADFARFLLIARASSLETESHLLEAARRGWLPEQDRQPLLSLCRRTTAAITRLHAYLRSCPPRGPFA